VRTVESATLAQWRQEADRTLYLLDVRSPGEFAAGHLPGARSAPGGQLVQATDAYVATHHARLVLADDTGVRATMTASWLGQMGWDEVWVLKDALAGAKLETGPSKATVLGLEAARPEEIAPEALAAALKDGTTHVVDLATSREYKAGHIAGAWFAVRSRFERSLPNLPKGSAVVLTSPDGVLARLAAPDAAQALGRPVRVLRGGTQAWSAAGRPIEAGKPHLADTPDDVWLRPYDRDTGQEAAMKEYLSWEVDLVEHIKRDGDARFRILGPR
jgi:rhodanese-related sulfurtransferase